ncbi:hypothetical protein PSYJA_03944 [Pseudomonas syringae pv. japonica str. M301072]|uniref:Uncharacterized protein n=1 Tax=Pseudomonas syringae pv. japonica str. M301072 TaxID=629262 RepID=F3FDA2_PSESX|nr:hypothetical protein PSYJA_03944 [Pseudomonas syringae pv. japonica str. M301072]
MKKDVISTHQLKALHALLPLLGDLAVELPAEHRYYRVLDALRELVPSDAVALLRFDRANLFLLPRMAWPVTQWPDATVSKTILD